MTNTGYIDHMVRIWGDKYVRDLLGFSSQFPSYQQDSCSNQILDVHALYSNLYQYT